MYHFVFCWLCSIVCLLCSNYCLFLILFSVSYCSQINSFVSSFFYNKFYLLEIICCLYVSILRIQGSFGINHPFVAKALSILILQSIFQLCDSWIAYESQTWWNPHHWHSEEAYRSTESRIVWELRMALFVAEAAQKQNNWGELGVKYVTMICSK